MQFKQKYLPKLKSNQPNDIFIYSISVLLEKIFIKKSISNDYRTHKQWANVIFGTADDLNTSLLSNVTHRFYSYLIWMPSRYNAAFDKMYKWNFEKICNEHPQICSEDDPKPIVSQLIHAVDDEIKSSKEQSLKNTYLIQELDTFQISVNEEVYVATLNLEEDDEPKIFEGLQIFVKIGFIPSFEATILEYDNLLQKVYFDCNYPLLRYSGDKSLIIDASWLLEKVKDKLIKFVNFDSSSLPINKFFTNNCKPNQFNHLNTIHLNIQNLDDSQCKAIIKAYKNDITLIWGPPGTGKSTALSYLINQFLESKDRTLICCIANVAVDVLTKKFVNLIEATGGYRTSISNGSVLRIGYTRDIELLGKDFLFPNSKIISDLRLKLRNLKLRLKDLNLSRKERIKYQKDIIQSQDLLKDAIKSVIRNAIIVFATASKVHSDSIFEELEYDNLIIDEASMMSVPHFVALTKNIKRRIIVTGDFRQLGPVVLSQTAMSQKWLYTDVFQFAGVDTSVTKVDHKAMSQLLIQRRIHPNICNLINVPFYQGKLKTEIDLQQRKEVLESYPFPNQVISYIDCRKEPNYVAVSRKGSRYNLYTVDVVGKILSKMLKSRFDFTIGVITPYRGQVIQHNKKLKEINASANKKERVKIGTIHSFQGSEADIIIFDFVDSEQLKVGLLFQHDQGKRLVNVALSRTKTKLIVVGDLEVLISGQGNNNVDSSVGYIAQTIMRHKVKFEVF
ncbi:MAG TPA: AAA domain-containing protein [Saprospiraceae bacterium]|nr:AAA domain-containing protein [Saprospiraceae bacterium]